MKAKQVYEFTRGGDPLRTLGIGYAATIYKFFDDLYINRDRYTIEDKQIIFENDLDLDNCNSLVELPDNLTIGSYLSLQNCINLIKLPNNLKIGNNLYLRGCTSLKELPNNLKIDNSLFLGGTLITQLPDDLDIAYRICIDRNQTKLIDWIEKSSKFKHYLEIR